MEWVFLAIVVLLAITIYNYKTRWCIFVSSSNTSVDSGLSITDSKREKTIFERILSKNEVVLRPDVITVSDGVTIEDETIVRTMTQFRGKGQKEGPSDVYW